MLTGQRGADSAVGTNGDLGCVIRDLDLRHHGQTIRVNQLPLGIAMPLTITGIGRLAIRALDAEETGTDHRHIQLLIGILELAGGEDLLGTHYPHTITHLNTDRRQILLILLGTRLALHLIKEIFKRYPITLETDRVHVSQVVGDTGHLGILCRQTCFTDP